MKEGQNRREWLRNAREAHGLSTYKAAAASGISQSYFSKVELGQCNVPVPTAKKIGAALGFDWKRFYE